MRVEVRFFSRLREVTGTPAVDREIAAGATLDDLLESLYGSYPGLRAWDACLLLAVGLEYAGRDQILHESDRVSVMPPVQGG